MTDEIMDVCRFEGYLEIGVQFGVPGKRGIWEITRRAQPEVG